MAQPGAFRRGYIGSDLPSHDVGGPAWAVEPPLTQLLATGHDFWARLSPQLPLKDLFLDRLHHVMSPHYFFLSIIFVGPIAWVFAYLGVAAELGASVGMEKKEVVRLTE